MQDPKPSAVLLRRHLAAMRIIDQVHPRERIDLLGYVTGLLPSPLLDRAEQDESSAIADESSLANCTTERVATVQT